MLVIFAGTSCNKADNSPSNEKSTRKNFAGTYVGTTHRWGFYYADTSHIYDHGTYSDSIIITTWSDSIRFLGIERSRSGGLVDLKAKDSGLYYKLTVSAGMRSYEICRYTLCDSCDSLKVGYIDNLSGPQNQSTGESAVFNGILKR